MYIFCTPHSCNLIQSAGSSQVLAEAVATITTNFTSFESSDVSVTATLIGNLTQDAIRDPEVCHTIEEGGVAMSAHTEYNGVACRMNYILLYHD